MFLIRDGFELLCFVCVNKFAVTELHIEKMFIDIFKVIINNKQNFNS